MGPTGLLFIIAVIAAGAFFLKMEDRPKAAANLTPEQRRRQRPNQLGDASTQGTRATTGEEGLRFAQARPPSVG